VAVSTTHGARPWTIVADVASRLSNRQRAGTAVCLCGLRGGPCPWGPEAARRAEDWPRSSGSRGAGSGVSRVWPHRC